MKELIKNTEEKMGKTINVLENDYTAIRAGRANASVLDRISVDYYGVPTPIQQMAAVSIPEPRVLMIQPWDASTLKTIEKAILVSDIGINPTNDGNVVRLVFPMLTDERRREIVKQVKKMGEDGKIAIRNIRRDSLDAFKKLKTAKEITEDQYAQYEAQIEKLTSKTVEAVDKVIQDKEKELLTI